MNKKPEIEKMNPELRERMINDPIGNSSALNNGLKGLLGERNTIPFLSGMPIYENELAMAATQAKKHKKKRINKKWLKRYGTKQVPGVIRWGNKLIVHPEIMQKMRTAF